MRRPRVVSSAVAGGRPDAPLQRLPATCCSRSAQPHNTQPLHPLARSHLRRYENCELRTVVLADEAGAHSHPDPLHFRGGHSVAEELGGN